VVTTDNISADLAGGSDVFSLSSITAGDSTTVQPDAKCCGYVLLWNSADPFRTFRVVPIPQLIDLTDTTTATVSAGTIDPAALATGI
jgi:hypothetical protein